MYFKRLELFGFKSFAEKTKLNFEPGVTAVVGPNGCGKSNVADAIKWVLGEQSAKELRGAKMEDVIFNGTANREPINMAEVSLVLDNKDKMLPIDFDEVVITRRLYRSGESQYLINKNPVRLKDVHELLAGTGMGRSSYSMIEQGRIGLICSSKPEERRSLFEEASGITKYKAKKKEALRKLEHTDTNLIRINDIVTEVQRQIRSIERQARKAERYKENFDILKDLDLKYSSYIYKNLLSESKKMNIEQTLIKKNEVDTSSMYEQLHENLDSARRSIEQLNNNLHALEKDIAEVSASIDKSGYTVELDKERISELKVSSETAKKEIEFLNDKYADRIKEVQTLKEKLSAIEQAKEDKQNALETYNQRLDDIVSKIKGFQQNIQQNRARVLDVVDIQTKTKNELIKIGAQVQNKRVRLTRLKDEQQQVQKEKTDFDSKMSEIDKQYNQILEVVKTKELQLDTCRNELGDNEITFNSIRTELSTKRGALEVLRSKKEMLKELIEKHEGFGNGVKAIIEKTQQQDVYINAKPLADLISIDSGYEQAVESVLGDLTNAIVVDKRSEAETLIKFLRENNIGRVNFVILEDALKISDHITDSLEGFSSISKYVKCEEQYKKVINCLLGNAFVVDSSTKADEIFSRYGNYSFVTKESYLRSGPRVFDGAVIEAETSVLGRKEKVKELSQLIDKTLMQIQESQKKELFYQDKIQENKQKIESKQDQLRIVHSELSAVDSKRQVLINNMKRIDDEKLVVDAEIYEEQTAIQTLTKNGEELNEELNKIEVENQTIHSLIVSSEADAKKTEELKEATLIDRANTQGELASIQIKYDNITENLNKRSSEYEEIKSSIEEKQTTIDNANGRIEELSNEIIQLQADNLVFLETQKQLDVKKQEIITKKETEITDYDLKEISLKQQEKDIEKYRNNIRDFEIKSNELNYKLTSIVDNVQRDYKTDLASVTIEIEDDISWEQTKEQIDELKAKLERMGPVNLVAIEEHRELEERYSFLTRQKDDLVNAKESLHKAILKINATTRKMFLETFEKVRAEFKNYFRMLFGGGQAEVFFLDERDVLESGIEIVVRPPGKKLQNIMLLSGGEKALTAIALLFSIFKVNPSPFCVLDEIDAPLDELNIDRFIRVLQEFLQMSQFIIITHNKKTIEMSDALYGVTMAQRGISKIVSVKLSENVKESEEDVEELLV